MGFNDDDDDIIIAVIQFLFIYVLIQQPKNQVQSERE
jgi:hypothetical protein